MSSQIIHTEFSPADMQALEPMMKIGLLATINTEGMPHLTLISSLRANTPSEMIWGQFTGGTSKQYIRQNPRVGFLVMTLDKNLWQGKATFTHTATQGLEFEMYNNTDMFRYNAYFGIHTVYYMDLIAHSGRQALPMGNIIGASVKTVIAKTLMRPRSQKEVINLWSRQLMSKLGNLKFLSYIGSDGYPMIIPAIQAQAADAEHVIFSTAPYRDDLRAIPPGATIAVFCMSLQMEDVLLRGLYQGTRKMGGIDCGRVRVDWIYNPMPPKPQQIYPRVSIEPVTTF